MTDKAKEIKLPISSPTEDDVETGIELAHQAPGVYLKTQGDCVFAARLAERERQLRGALSIIAEKDARISQLEAARIAYASEFPLNADGEPDVGNIHANIRALKQQHAEDRKEIERLKKALQYVIILDNIYVGKDFKEPKGSNSAIHLASIVDQMAQTAEDALSPAPQS